MIRHIVLFKFRSATTDQEKDDLIQKLQALTGQVEGIVQLEIHRDILHTEDSFDLGLFITLVDQASLQLYGASSERQATSAYARSLCDQVVLFDYEVV